jgi:DNA-binding NarL/FixJ family response regulator
VNRARTHPPVTVVVADAHARMRHSLRRLLETSGEAHVVAEAGDLALTAQHVAGHRPDVLVLDLGMRDGSSLELIGALREQSPQLRVVATSLEDGPVLARRAIAAGAAGFVAKEHADTVLPRAVRDAAGPAAV